MKILITGGNGNLSKTMGLNKKTSSLLIETLTGADMF